MNEQIDKLILNSETNSNKIENGQDMNLQVIENNEKTLQIKQLNDKIDDMKGQAEAQEKFMNMVVHDMRNPSEAINNGLKQAKELMKKEIDSIMKDIKSLYKKNQTSYKNQKNNLNLQRNLSLQPLIFQRNQSIQQNSLSRLQSVHYQQLARKSISIGRSSLINSGNSKEREQKKDSQNGSDQKKSSLNKYSIPNDSYKNAQIIKQLNEKVEQNQKKHNLLERKSISSNINKNESNQILSGQKIKQLDKQSFQNRSQYIQVEEEKISDQQNNSHQINLRNNHQFQQQINILNGRNSSGSPSGNMIMKNIQASNILSNMQSNHQFSNQLNRYQEEGQIDSFQIQQQHEKDFIQILNDLTFKLNSYHQQINQPANQNVQIRGLHNNQNQIQNNNALQDEQEDDRKYDFNDEEIQEAIQPAPQNQNQIQSQQQYQNLKNASNIQQSSLIINQPRDICPREGTKYLKRKKSQNQRLQQSIIRPQRRQEHIKFIQKEVVVYKEDLTLKMERSIQTEQENFSSQSQNIHAQNIIQEVEKLLQSKQLMEFLEIYKSYSELLNKVQQQQNKRMKPQEIVAILIDNLSKKDSYGIKSRQLSSQASIKNLQSLQSIQKVQQQIDEIDEGSQSISCLSINQGDKESNLQIEALKRVQNIRISNQHQMRRLKNSNLNQDSNIQQSNLIDSEQKDENLSPLGNRQLKHSKSQKWRLSPDRKNASSKSINQINPIQKDEYNENENKFLLAVLEKLKKVLQTNKTVEYYIQNSISSAGIIANLTEDLLTLAKIKNNVFELNIEQNVNLLDIVNEAYQVLSFNSENKKIGLFLEFDLNSSNLLQNVTTDKRRIIQILLNFLSNSIKFTQEGGIIKIALKIMEEISLGEPNIISKEDKDKDVKQNEEIKKLIQLQIEIQDTGAGISKENIGKLFTDFAKLNEHKQMNAKGTGLGLSICKQIVEQMGGKVSVYSKVGVGTKFVITLSLNAYDKVIYKEISNSSNEYSIVNNQIVYCPNFQNNFEVDDEFNQKVDVSSDEKNNFQKVIKQNGNILKIFKFSTQKNKNMSDKYQNTINQIMKSIKERKPKESQSININTSFIDNFSQIELSESNSQYDIINENLMNFKPLKSAIMDSLMEQNEDENQDEAYVLRKMKNNLNQSNLIEYLNMSQINYTANDDVQIQQIFNDNFNFQINNQVKFIVNQNQQNQIQSPVNQNFFRESRNSNFSSISNQFIIKDQSDFQRRYINNQNLLNSSQQSEKIYNNELNKIDEMKESSSLQISYSNEASIPIAGGSIKRKISSQLVSMSSLRQKKENILENEDLQEYLRDNIYLREAIDISMKFPRKKLQFLVANDDSYSLFFISTSVSQLKNVGHLDKAEDGKVALELVQKNVQQDDIHNNFYDAIFLDLDMPHLNGNEACKQIQQYYYSRAKDNFEINQINQDQLQVKMNFINFPDKNMNEELYSKMKKLQEKKITPDWIIGLKKIYDIYFEIQQKIDEEIQKSENNEIDSQLVVLNETKDQVFKVFNILYTNQRYMSLQLMKRPFIFAYSALINNKVIEETKLNGFDKCVDSPLNKLKIEGLIDESIEMWAYQLTKIMLENIGPVPKINELIDINQVMNSQKVSSGEIYKSVLKNIKNGKTLKQSSQNFMQQIQECAISSEILNDSVEEQKNNFCLGKDHNSSQKKSLIKLNQNNSIQS